MELEQLRDKLTPKQAKFCLLFVQEGDTKTATAKQHKRKKI